MPHPLNERIPLTPQSLPLCPELQLWLLDPRTDLDADHRSIAGDETPYWAFCWASGQALARFLLDHPDRVDGKHVLDFGSGSGVAAIAAARAGASGVTACDTDAGARLAIQRNAELNHVTLEITKCVDRNHWEVVLASDVCYEPGIGDWLASLASSGHHVLVSDPGRPGLPRRDLVLLAEYSVRTQPDLDEPTPSTRVYEFERSRGIQGDTADD